MVWDASSETSLRRSIRHNLTKEEVLAVIGLLRIRHDAPRPEGMRLRSGRVVEKGGAK